MVNKIFSFEFLSFFVISLAGVYPQQGTQSLLPQENNPDMPNR